MKETIICTEHLCCIPEVYDAVIAHISIAFLIDRIQDNKIELSDDECMWLRNGLQKNIFTVYDEEYIKTMCSELNEKYNMKFNKDYFVFTINGVNLTDDPEGEIACLCIPSLSDDRLKALLAAAIVDDVKNEIDPSEKCGEADLLASFLAGLFASEMVDGTSIFDDDDEDEDDEYDDDEDWSWP